MSRHFAACGPVNVEEIGGTVSGSYREYSESAARLDLAGESRKLNR